MKNKRIAIFSFSKDWAVQDFIFFIVVVVIYAIIVTLHELAAERGSVDTLIVIVGHISSFIPVAIVLAFIFEK